MDGRRRNDFHCGYFRDVPHLRKDFLVLAGILRAVERVAVAGIGGRIVIWGAHTGKLGTDQLIPVIFVPEGTPGFRKE
ncbi:hypothetical protein AHIS1636_07900 [Arthrobacter mangrovi]|uniref:Uncharacterized protein n=1 Tax=Arthrobacter mangrovi TaxID=2966350 RepID=A0ABQ5MQT3_9MICC|nr:hypothetical protein AHIS1636_07900 [Arthrobacter mangrovi]